MAMMASTAMAPIVNANCIISFCQGGSLSGHTALSLHLQNGRGRTERTFFAMEKMSVAAATFTSNATCEQANIYHCRIPQTCTCIQHHSRGHVIRPHIVISNAADVLPEIVQTRHATRETLSERQTSCSALLQFLQCSHIVVSVLSAWRVSVRVQTSVQA